jgi:hypothetical protein
MNARSSPPISSAVSCALAGQPIDRSSTTYWTADNSSRRKPISCARRVAITVLQGLLHRLVVADVAGERERGQNPGKADRRRRLDRHGATITPSPVGG